MVKLTTKEDVALLVEEASEMFEETGCVPDYAAPSGPSSRGSALGAKPTGVFVALLSGRRGMIAVLAVAIGQGRGKRSWRQSPVRPVWRRAQKQRWVES